MKRFTLCLVLSLSAAAGCATTRVVAHPSPRTQAIAKCLAAADAGIVAPSCAPLASEVAALRILSAQAVR